MLASMLMVLFFIYALYFSSYQVLITLMSVELLLLSFILLSVWGGGSLFSALMVILVGVCVGAYGISLMVSLARSKGSSFFISFLS